MKKVAPAQRYTIWCLIALSLSGLALWGVLTGYIGGLMLQGDGVTLVSAVARIMGDELVRTSSPQRFTGFIRVRLMELNGKVIFSDKPGEVGRTLLSSSVSGAAGGKYSSRFVNIVTTKGESHALEAVGPFRGRGGKKYVLSVVSDASALEGRLTSMRLVAASAIASAIICLFFAMARIGRLSAKGIIARSWELAGEKVELAESLEKLEQDYISTLQAITTAVDCNDTYANGHSSRVAECAIKIGKEMGLAVPELKRLKDAAIFHDIGKIWIPDYLLHKEGPLSSDEFSLVRTHPLLGAEIMASLPSLKELAPAVLYHHERFDGKGYPRGLKRNEIPLESRILAVADTFDAMTSERPYRSAKLLREALEEIYAGAGSQFDPRVVEAFMNVLDDIAKEAENMNLSADRFGARLYSMVGNC